MVNAECGMKICPQRHGAERRGRSTKWWPHSPKAGFSVRRTIQCLERRRCLRFREEINHENARRPASTTQFSIQRSARFLDERPWSIATDAKVRSGRSLPNPENFIFWPRALNGKPKQSTRPADQRSKTRTWFPTASMKLRWVRRPRQPGPAHWLSLEDKRYPWVSLWRDVQM